MLGLPMILPGVMSNFFAGGTAGIFANQVGGRRGTIIGCIAHGIFIMILPAFTFPNAWTDWIPEHDMYRRRYCSNRILLHDH